MEKQEEKFNILINEIEEIIFKKAPSLNDRYTKMQKLDYFDKEEFNDINDKLDVLRKKYTELRNNITEIDKERGIREINEIIKKKRIIDKKIFEPDIEYKYSPIKSISTNIEDNTRIVNLGYEEIEFRNVSDDNFEMYLELIRKIWIQNKDK